MSTLSHPFAFFPASFSLPANSKRVARRVGLSSASARGVLSSSRPSVAERFFNWLCVHDLAFLGWGLEPAVYLRLRSSQL